MEELAISKFKATCLAVLHRVRHTRKPVRITRFGTPIAEIVPPTSPPSPTHWLGALTGTATIRGDLVSPALDTTEWEALRS